MHGLLSRLADIDSGAERGLRVIEFFDQLTVHRADAEAVARATAVLAETTAGVIFDGTGEIWAVAPDGSRLTEAGPDRHSRIADIVADDRVVGRAWLGRAAAETGHEWDELILSRMALTLVAVHARTHSGASPGLGLADPALVHILISGESDEADTARAARLLGFIPGEAVRVLAIDMTGEHEHALSALRDALAASAGRRACAALLSGSLAAILLAGSKAPLAPGARTLAVCVGPEVPIEQAARSWHDARRGLRFTNLSGRRWSIADDLGCLIALADLDPAYVRSMPDVRAIARMSETRSRRGDLALIESLGRCSSIRETGAVLHMHHSSVVYRLAKITDSLGYDLRSPQGQYRAYTALLLWQLHSGQIAAT